MVPKASLHLHLLTEDHFSATHTAGASICDPVPLLCDTITWCIHWDHPIQDSLEHHVAVARASCRAPQSTAFTELHIYMVLPFVHDDEVSQVLKCHNQSIQLSLHEGSSSGVTTR